MDKNRPVLITSEEISKLPILIVDKKGIVGSALAKILRDQFLVVVVTGFELEKHSNIIQVPYHKKIPMIPDNAYSHIFVIYNGETELLDMIFAFEEKAEAVNARFFFITSLLYSSRNLFTVLQRPKNRLLQTVIYGETFNNAITEANELNFFIHQARIYGRIEVPKDGLGMLYPILFDDVLTSLVSLAFAIEKPKEIIYLFPHHVLNEITVARIMQKIDPLIKIDFSKKKSPARNYYVPPDGLYFFREYILEDKLRKIDLSRTHGRPKVPQKKIHLKIPDGQTSQGPLKFLFVALLAIFIAPLIASFICALCGAGFLTLSIKEVEQGNLQTADTTASIAQTAFSISNSLGPSLFLPQLIFPQQTAQFITSTQTGEIVSETEISLIQATKTVKNIYEGKSLDPKDDFLQATTTIKSTLLTMQKLEAENELPKSVLQKIHDMDSAINLVEETIDTWTNLFGFDGDRTYLILFENNMELRPGGGFIGSYGILPIENGRPGKLQINNVYNADGQLTKQVQPPYGLQRYLGISHLFLRDSNFDPDFTKDSAQAAQLLSLETGQHVNGVIAIDTTFLKNIISVVGPITLPDYRVTITPDNFYLLTETYAEKNSFPGSTQKQDFLKSLTDALVNKLSTEKHIPYDTFIQMIVTSLKEKDLLMAFSDPGIQNVFTVNDLSSSLWDGRMFKNNGIYDYFGVVDSNLGTNKVNYYIKRSIAQTSGIDDSGAMRTTATVTYTNTATKTSPYGGDYRDYVRFLVPANADLISVAFNNTQVQTSPAVTDPSIFTLQDFTPPAGLEVDQSQEQKEKVIGFFFIVPIGTTKTVSITYTLPGTLDTSSTAFSYNIKLFKEPGTNDDPYQLFLAYPNDFTLFTGDRDFTNVGGKLIYAQPLSEDKTISATFSKK